MSVGMLFIRLFAAPAPAAAAAAAATGNATWPFLPNAPSLDTMTTCLPDLDFSRFTLQQRYYAYGVYERLINKSPSADGAQNDGLCEYLYQ
ncbi:hypothetical protein BCR42DRAFT_444150 [Absidia repens]|uniref:Secreted protein n=1 Tax=Absidia repens TaxID=90262 RepID=A0A1X2HBG4_9FUNG|nr:hypothetical protein BCR42DRAFT_444796 [Absidia repens]ORZ04467.1 hypothetical protein BCR42DRAFT_444150 [Absidia repens]